MEFCIGVIFRYHGSPIFRTDERNALSRVRNLPADRTLARRYEAKIITGR